MARRRTPVDPELAALARERLARLLGDDPPGARRASPAGPGRRGADDDVGVAGAAHEAGVGEGVGPDDLEPARRFTRWHLAVVVAVLLVGVVWGGWSWFRTRPVAVAVPPVVQTAGGADPSGASPASSSTPAPAGPGAPSDAGAAEGPVVHVLGAVRRPGLVRLEAGARVEDALEAAGGLRRDADTDELNLAQPLDDGVQVVVGTRDHPAGEVRPPGTTGAGAGSASGSGGGSAGSSSGGSASSVDLNRATVDQLDTLPGVGPVTAQKIVDWRSQHGRFSRVEELQEVDGIGPKTYARLAPRVRV